MISEFLTQDHHHCNDLFATAENAVVKDDWGMAERYFTDFQKETERHFGMEESLLFPAFEKATGMSTGPTEVMRTEHQQMRSILADMAESVRVRNKDAYLGASETILMLMQQHNLKEEQMLYRMADQVLAGAQGAAILESMRALEG